jgi:uncharacterized membrane protein
MTSQSTKIQTDGFWKSLLARHSSFFIYGLVFWLPVILVVYILSFLFDDMDSVGKSFLNIFIPGRFLFPGSGFVLCILVVYFSGVILKKPGPSRLLSRLPIIGPFFSGGSVMTLDRLAHLAPCLFLYSPTCISYGWILSEEKVTSPDRDEVFPIINVYYPNVPTLITGQVFAARKDTIIRLANSSSEVIYLLLYAFRSPVSLRYKPWDDETPEHFAARIRSFGIIFEHGDNLKGATPSSSETH